LLVALQTAQLDAAITLWPEVRKAIVTSKV
jgi:hypothetical protein